MATMPIKGGRAVQEITAATGSGRDLSSPQFLEDSNSLWENKLRNVEESHRVSIWADVLTRIEAASRGSSGGEMIRVRKKNK